MPIHALCSLLTLSLSKGLVEGRIQNFCVISGFKTSVSIRQIRVRLQSMLSVYQVSEVKALRNRGRCVRSLFALGMHVKLDDSFHIRRSW